MLMTIAMVRLKWALPGAAGISKWTATHVHWAKMMFLLWSKERNRDGINPFYEKLLTNSRFDWFIPRLIEWADENWKQRINLHLSSQLTALQSHKMPKQKWNEHQKAFDFDCHLLITCSSLISLCLCPEECDDLTKITSGFGKTFFPKYFQFSFELFFNFQS